MRLTYNTDSFGYLPFEEMLDTVKTFDIKAIELATGNWSQAPHLELDKLLDSEDERKKYLEAIHSRGLDISALNCSGNHLANNEDGRKSMEVVHKTFKLAELFGIKKIVMMSGLPCGCKEDRTPVWVTTSWPPETQDVLDYQWNEVAIPEWKKLVKLAESHGIEKIAIENHPYQLVYNVETMKKLREAVGPMVGINLDPSHMFWQNCDPIAAARSLSGMIYHVHGKDSRMERVYCEENGVLDTKTIDKFADRSWNFVAMGCGHDLGWWREFFSVVKMSGYNGDVSLEMEDLTMSAYQGVDTSVKILKESIILD